MKDGSKPAFFEHNKELIAIFNLINDGIEELTSWKLVDSWHQRKIGNIRTLSMMDGVSAKVVTIPIPSYWECI